MQEFRHCRRTFERLLYPQSGHHERHRRVRLGGPGASL
jgi:hypothetical protein